MLMKFWLIDFKVVKFKQQLTMLATLAADFSRLSGVLILIKDWNRSIK